MRCVNPSCGRELEPGSLFCTFCGSPQASEAPAAASPKMSPRTDEARTSDALPPARAPGESDATPVTHPSTPSGSDTLVMRASESIWDFTESEGRVEPGKRRPTIVMDEQCTHLVGVDRKLGMTDLHRRVKAAVEAYQVPVDVRMVNARWLNDEKETRDRIVASLRGHVFQDIKVILGLDYMGEWASIHMSIGMEPTAIEEDKPFELPQDAKFALIGGALALLLALATEQMTVGAIGLAALAYGGWRYKTSKAAHVVGVATQRALSEAKRFRERQARTYKYDDMDLFRTAMMRVFEHVVDDIVQTGAKVVKIEAAHGGYFSDRGEKHGASSARSSDAADLDV